MIHHHQNSLFKQYVHLLLLLTCLPLDISSSQGININLVWDLSPPKSRLRIITSSKSWVGVNLSNPLDLSQAWVKVSSPSCWNENIYCFPLLTLNWRKFLFKNLATTSSYTVKLLSENEFDNTLALSYNEKGNRLS